jgi:cysteine desulfurase
VTAKEAATTVNDTDIDSVAFAEGSTLSLLVPTPIYLDGHATTPLAPEAATAMEPWWSARAANAHSLHLRGQEAARAVEGARAQVGSLIGAEASELVFTSGATESNNLVLIGVAEAARRRGCERKRVVVSEIEHKSVLAAASELARRDFDVVRAPVRGDGIVDIERLRSLVDETTLLVSVMAANNEVGVLQPLREVVAIAREAGALVHADVAQAAGKVPVDVSGLDYASLSSHKLDRRALGPSSCQPRRKCDHGRYSSAANKRTACARARYLFPS